MPLRRLVPGLLLALLLLTGPALTQGNQQQPQQQQVEVTPQVNQAPEGKGAGLDHALSPKEAGIALKPVPVEFGGMKGWKVTLQGGHPLATPAWHGGRLYLGGGFGSHEFYSLEGRTGELAWLYRTADDGPTAAVCQGGFIAFNTESCELEILQPDGKRVWKKWLGDPLMSMPALHRGRVFMAFPDSRGDRRHYLAAFALDSGKELWRQPLEGEIITAPVVSDGRVHLATLEGLVYTFDLETGKKLASERRNATSSPSVWGGRLYYSQRQEVPAGAERRQAEQLVAQGAGSEGEVAFEKTRRTADYLDYERKRASAGEQQNQGLDASVGFAGSKGDAKIVQAQTNLGEGSVYGVWSYQGGRPFFSAGRMFSSLGDEVTCVDAESGEVLWKRGFPAPGAVDRTLVPPALANGKVFVATRTGEVHCLRADTGKSLWSVKLPESLRFQVAVADGRVYVPTDSGTLYCLETGDPADDGWFMWGANAEHDGLPVPLP